MERIFERIRPSVLLVPLAFCAVLVGGGAAVALAFLIGAVVCAAGLWLDTYGLTHHRG